MTISSEIIIHNLRKWVDGSHYSYSGELITQDKGEIKAILYHIDAQEARIAELDAELNMATEYLKSCAEIHSNSQSGFKENYKAMREAEDRAEAAEKELAALRENGNYREEFIDACRTIGAITKLLGIAEDEVTGHPSQIFDAIEALKSDAASVAVPDGSRLVVKLPKRYSPEGYHIDEAYLVEDAEGDWLDRDEVIEAIKAAGGSVEDE